MKFDIDEIIELVNGKRYIVVDKLEENYIWYYNVYEVDDNNNVLDTSLIVKTEVKNGKTLITKTTNEELEKIFKARLNWILLYFYINLYLPFYVIVNITKIDFFFEI